MNGVSPLRMNPTHRLQHNLLLECSTQISTPAKTRRTAATLVVAILARVSRSRVNVASDVDKTRTAHSGVFNIAEVVLAGTITVEK